MIAATPRPRESAPSEKYELWRPTITRQKRAALEHLHLEVAKVWSHSLTGYLPKGVTIELDKLAFERFSATVPNLGPKCQIAVFSLEQTQVNGFLATSEALAKYFVTSRLGLSQPTASDEAEWTKIETAIARAASRSLLGGLAEVYAKARLGKIGAVRECHDLNDSFQFDPDEFQIVARFKVAGDNGELRVLAALGSGLINLVRQGPLPTLRKNRNSQVIADVGRQLPIDVDVVLGSWDAPLIELTNIRPGDQILLPEGEDAWLVTRGVRLRAAKIQVAGNRATVEVKGRLDR